MTYALDTNTLIHYFKGMGRVAERLMSVPPAEVAVPSIVVFELELGIAKLPHAGGRRAQLQTFLSHTKVLPFDRLAASTAAEIRVGLEAQGMGIGPLDTLIAGTALANGVTLVTRNAREFGRVDGLVAVNWFD